MQFNFALDLKVARRKAGLTQQDVAHLLDIQESRVSRLENGKAQLGIHEIAALTLVYGKPFEGLFAEALDEIAEALPERMSNMPACQDGWLGRFNRENTLSNITNRLLGEPEDDVCAA